MPLNFVSIDIETAAATWDTICQISLVRVRDGVITDEYTTLVNPECDFKPMNIHVHGITPEKVAEAPTFSSIASDILSFIGDDILVSHNAPFDMNSLQKALLKAGCNIPRITTFCTLACARTYNPGLCNHKLPTVSNWYNVALRRHHDAAADARACAGILISMSNRIGADTVQEMANYLQIDLGEINQISVLSPHCNIKNSESGQFDNPFSILADLKAACPDIANEITITQLKSGRQFAFKCEDGLLFYFFVSSSPYIRVADVGSPLRLSPQASQYKAGDWKLPVNSQLQYQAFLELMCQRAVEIYNQTTGTVFGCCNDFIICSDALKCHKKADPFYRGCLYRKNLEAGRVFYGKNRNV